MLMSVPRWIALIAIAAAGLLQALPAWAQSDAANWPNHAVRVIVAGAPGDGADLAGRLLGVKLQERLGRSFVIDNKPGAGGIVGSEAAKNSAPDGYNFIIGNAGSHGINAAVYAKLAYDPLRDFVPVFLINKAPNVCVINSKSPAHTLAEFIALAKESPGKFTFASGGNGSSAHLNGEYLKMVAGIDMLHVPYKGANPALTALLAGEIDLFCGNLPPAMPHIRSGLLRALAVTTLQRNFQLPEVPTMAETFPGFESVAWFGYFAPKGTPQAIVDKFAGALAEVIKLPDVQTGLAAQGSDAVGSGPAEFRTFQEAEIAKWTKVAHAANVHL
jgi:tripartite-type tricarboxylate transporter receptor subunit TctC